MQGRPVNAIVAIGCALLVWPVLQLLDWMNRGCGDGLCGFFSGLLILGALAAVTAVFVVRSARRGEAPGMLRWAPVLLWLGALVPLVR
jgi:hypothetical protein